MNLHIQHRCALAGLAGVALSVATILIMAALRADGYSHLTKAVSELGSLDAPRRWWFNGLGYLLPGVLIAALAQGLRRHLRPRPAAFWLLTGSGLLMALAGLFPMDMEQRRSFSSLVHTVGSLGSGVCWLGCALTIAPALRADARWADLARWLPWLPLLVFGLMLLVPAGMPGLVQRLSFAGYFSFVVLLASRLWRLTRLEAADKARG
ncbi:DUF998 domain-containing protein [Hymenobacter coalescens]